MCASARASLEVPEKVMMAVTMAAAVVMVHTCACVRMCACSGEKGKGGCSVKQGFWPKSGCLVQHDFWQTGGGVRGIESLHAS